MKKKPTDPGDEQLFNAAKENLTLDKAIKFAVERHAGQLRKGTVIPYIVHPLDVMQILRTMNADVALMAAGVLHDTVEDTDTTVEELARIFGADIANLVASHSEDKSKSWRERKQVTVDELRDGDVRVRKLIMADKLANLRDMVRDYRSVGERLWERFRASPEDQAWYNSSCIDALYGMQFEAETKDAYWELNSLFKDLFVKFYRCVVGDDEYLYQIGRGGESYILKKGSPEWLRFEGTVPDGAVATDRREAEFLEEYWNVPFYAAVDADLVNADYDIAADADRSVNVSVTDGELSVTYEGYIEDGDLDVYVFYDFDAEGAYCFFTRLRILCGTELTTEELLKSLFPEGNGCRKLESFLEMYRIDFSKRVI